MTTADLESKITAIATDVQELSKEISIVVVKDSATEQQAIDFLGAIKSRSKRIEELRKFFTQPLNDQVKAINNKFKLQLEPLADLEEKLKSALVKYADEKERLAKIEADRIQAEYEEQQRIEQEKIAEAQRKEAEATAKAEKATSEAARKRAEAAAEAARRAQEKAQAKLDQSVVPLVEAPVKSVRAEGGLFTAKKIWVWEIEDESLLRKSRPDLFILDEKLVTKIVREGTLEIPGLRIFQKTEANMRT